MIKGKGLAVLKERIEVLDQNEKDFYRFLGCEQPDKISIKQVMERVKKEIRKKLDHH